MEKAKKQRELLKDILKLLGEFDAKLDTLIKLEMKNNSKLVEELNKHVE